MATNEDKWLTVNEAAKLSGYHPESIRELIRRGEIKARKFSFLWQVSNKSLFEYVAKAQESGEKRGPKTKN